MRKIPNKRRCMLGLSASVLAMMVASPVMAQSTVLTSSSANYDLVNSTDEAVEISSGTDVYFTRDGMQWALPANTPGIFVTAVNGWEYGISGDSSCTFSWECAKAGAPLIKVDSGATLTFGGTQWQSWYSGGEDFQSLIEATGDVVFQGGGTWTFLGNNSFLGNVTVLDGADLQFGWNWSAANVTFGTDTNIDLQGTSQLIFYDSGTMTIGGRISGSSASSVELNGGTLVVNGQNTVALPFLGTVNVAADQTFMVGDASHPSAIFGDPSGKTAAITLNGTTSTLSGYGTIYGNVTSYGIIKAGGSGNVVGNLTIDGDLTQDASGQIYTSISPTGVSGLVINGKAKVDGELIVSIAEGTYGNNVFPLVTATDFSGSFNTISTSGYVSGAMVGILQTTDGYSIVTENGSAAQVFGHVAYANRMALTNFVSSLYDAMTMTPASGAAVDTWIAPIGQIENLSRDGLGYEQKTYGTSLGAMHRFAQFDGVIGGAFSYRRGNMTVKDDPATASTNGYDFAVYGGANVKDVRFEGSAFYNIYDANTKRPMGTYGTSQADQNGFAWGVSGQMGYDMYRKRLTPYVRGTYARVHLEAAKETGSDQYDLSHEAINLNTFVVDLGLRAHLVNPQPDRRIKIDANLAWRYDLSDPGETVVASFANFSSGTSSSYWQGDSKHALVGGVDVAGHVADGLEIYGHLGGTLTSHRRAGELTAGVKYSF